MSEPTQNILTIASGITSVSASLSKRLDGFDVNRTFQATLTGTGAVSATVIVEFSNDGIGWVAYSVATLTLSGTNLASDGFTTTSNWVYARANVTAISGTNAAVTVTAGG